MNIGLRKTAIVLQMFIGQPFKLRIDIGIGEAFGRQFSFEFGTTVFAVRKCGDCQLANLQRRLYAQASVSMDSSSFPVLVASASGSA